jgi:hypothetical protein
VAEQLPAFENEDWGLLLYGLASMGQPLAPSFVEHLSAAAARRFHALSGEALGLLAWGLAQYGGPLPLVLSAGADAGGGALFADLTGLEGDSGGIAAEAAAAAATAAWGGGRVPPEQVEALARRGAAARASWWEDFYAECGDKWATAGPRGAALTLIGLGLLDEAEGLPLLPPGVWQAGAFGALRAAFGRPDSWEALVGALRGAAAADPDEPLPEGSAWFKGMLLEWGRRCGLEPPARGLGPLLAAPGAAVPGGGWAAPRRPGAPAAAAGS